MERPPASAPDPVAALTASDLFDLGQREVLRALCETFIPALDPPAGDDVAVEFWRRGAAQMMVAEGVELALVGAEIDGQVSAGLRTLLDELGANGMSLDVPLADREQLVHGFNAAGPDALAGIATFRSLAGSVFYAAPDPATGRNPNWETIGFPGPAAPPPTDRERPLRVRGAAGRDEHVEADVCVVGSGAGGAVIAAELAQTGRRVVVLEAGFYHDDAGLRWAGALGLPAALPERRALPDGRRSGFDRCGGGGWRRHGCQLDQLPADLRSRSCRMGWRSRSVRPRGVELRRAPRCRLRAARGQR